MTSENLKFSDETKLFLRLALIKYRWDYLADYLAINVLEFI